MVHELSLQFRGPFSWVDDGDVPCIFTADLGQRAGIYLWTIRYTDGELVYYVGETGRKFSVRMLEHFREHMSGGYHLYEPMEFVKGHKVPLWPGRYDPVYKTTVTGFLQRFARLAPAIEELARLYRFWLAPLECERRLRERIEAALAEHLYAQPGMIGNFQDRGIRYRGRRANEAVIKVFLQTEIVILGLPDTLWV